MKHWVGFDLDGTLAEAVEPFSPAVIGPPNPYAVVLVRRLLDWGVDVRVFTSRVAVVDGLESEHGCCDVTFAARQRRLISEWTRHHVEKDLQATATKDFACVAIVDDIAIEWFVRELRHDRYRLEARLEAISRKHGTPPREQYIDFYRPGPGGRR